MKTNYKVGDWVIMRDEEKIESWQGGYPAEQIIYPEQDMSPGGFSVDRLRLATHSEIIAAGGTPNKIELNYEIY